MSNRSIPSSQKPSCYVDVVSELHQSELTALRCASYQKYYGEDVDLSALRWNPWDLRFFSLGVFDNGRLISILRLAHIKTAQEFQQMMLSDFDSSILSLPVVILSRAATHEDFESRGFHTLLRYYAFDLAFASGANWIAGTFKMDSIRTQQLSSMGYELTVNPIPWNDFLKSHDPTYMATINLPLHFERARLRMRKSIESLLNAYPPIYSRTVLLERMRQA